MTVPRVAFTALTLLGVVQAQYVEQSPSPLVGSGMIGGANQGNSVVLSADGNTALTGGPSDNGQNGAAWVFVRINGNWTQQGNKLVGSGAVGATPTRQGYSVALSADGNTALIGGPGDNNGAGAVWLFTRSGGVWTQHGSKITVSDAIGNARLGTSVAMSADGSTSIAGGPGDNNGVGAAWILDTYIGPSLRPDYLPVKLVGTGAIGSAQQGSSVALAGNTALIGGPHDNGQAGAVWVFTGGGITWTQQGAKLVGMGAVGSAQQGFAVALSGDGNTAVEGGPLDNSNTGAAWVFARSGGIWMQQGNKLLHNGVLVTGPQQGASVALSSSGDVAAVGASGLKNGALLGPVGAAFVYGRSNGTWRERGIVESINVSGAALQGASVAMSAAGGTVVLGAPDESGNGSFTGAIIPFILRQPRDFDADGRADALEYDPVTGTSYTALSNGDGTYRYVYSLFTPGFDTLLTCDFNNDLKADLALYNSHTGLGYIGLGNGDGTFSFQSLFWSPGYDMVECGKLLKNGGGDVVLYNSSTGTMYAAFSNGSGGFGYLKAVPGPGFTITRPAFFVDFGFIDLHLANYTGNQPLLYNRSTGELYFAYYDTMPGFVLRPFGGNVGPRISPGYDLIDVGDLNGDGYADVILYNSSNGNPATGISDGKGNLNFTPLLFSPGFTSLRLADYTGDGKADLTLYNKNTAIGYFGTGDGAGNFTFQSLFWSPGYDFILAQDVNGDGKTDVVLYNSTDGTLYTGISNGDGTFHYTYSYWGPGKVLAK